MKTHSPGERARPALGARDVETLEGLSHDGFQSPRARKRAHALLLLARGTPVESVLFRTGLTAKSLSSMLERMNSHGIHGAIFDRPHAHKVRAYDHEKLGEEIRRLLASRPPAGMLRWSLEALTMTLRETLPEAKNLSREVVRGVMKSELGIKSIRFVEPYWYLKVRKMA